MNSFGSQFKVTLFGESHGEAIGVVIDGIPAGISISTNEFQKDLERRSGGKIGTTTRIEEDNLQILSGIYKGFTTGSPIAIMVKNLNISSEEYDSVSSVPRPGHADFVSQVKHKGYADLRGGGHHSGRVTVALVIAALFAKKIIAPIQIETEIIHIGGENPWNKKLEEAISKGDSLGGVIECRVKGIEAGIGDPFFNSLESIISHIIFAIPGIRGIEFGDGFAASKMWGSEHNDPIISSDGKTLRNGAGGINGGISNGNDIVFRVAVKPTSSISKTQNTFDFEKREMKELAIEGRHDTCFALRVPVVIEAAVAIALANLCPPL